MRRAPRHPWLVLLLAVSAFSACTCSTPPATPITLKAINDLDFDIYVANDVHQGGLTVARGDGSSLAPVKEAPACACQKCESACGVSTCQCTTTPMAHRIRKGQSFARVFDGNEHPATRANCGAGDLGPICFQDGAPLPAGQYTLQLCYAASVTGSDSPDDDFAGAFDQTAVTCVTKSFTYPDQKEWDISPPPPQPCGKDHACPEGQLCQRGTCSASCLGNDVPALSSSWNLAITIANDQAFFNESNSEPDRFTGTGQVGSSSYDGTSLRLTLSRAVGAGHATAEVDVTFPHGVAPPAFSAAETVSLTIIKTADENRKNSTAIAIRDAQNNLRLAADMGFGGPLLGSAELQPFSVSAGGTPFACNSSDICGRRVHSTIVFAADGAQTEVEPGKTVSVTSGGAAYNATAVENYTDRSGSPSSYCDPEGILSFVIGRGS